MTRTPTPVDHLANDYFADLVALSPIAMTSFGVNDRQDELDDFSPDGLDQQYCLIKATLAKVQQAHPVDETDRITLAAMTERLGLEAETHEAGADLSSVSNIASGLHSMREVFDLMPMDSDSDWATIGRRLAAIPRAVDSWFMAQEAAHDQGLLPAARQVETLASQCAGWADTNGFFLCLDQRAHEAVPDLSLSTSELLDAGIQTAVMAYREAARRLREDVMTWATPEDAVGETRYQLASRYFLGTTLDLRKTYAWGLEQVAQLEANQQEICAALRPGLTVSETKEALDRDDQYLLHGPDAMRQWMQTRADAVIEELSGTHFDIPEPVRRIECMIAPTHDGGIYYTPPTDDFSRPGRMWWSVPESQTTFSTWRELTTVHHEGVPGHHLQLGQAIWNKEALNDWRRNGVWVSGHGEGWALYAEQLMADLGYLADPAMMLGMLDGQALRAVRVVLDIGVHCGFDAPANAGGGQWTFDKALNYFNSHVAMDEDVARFEVLRYFGWPGQAPAYKIGQRVWTDLRDECSTRQGSAFSLKAFHTQALNLGALGLDTLRDAILTN